MDGVETPASGIPVTAAPYDRDSIITALERAQGSPRPHTAALDSLFADFRGPFLAQVRARRAETAVRDSVERGLLPRAALDAASARVVDSRPALESARATLASRGDSLRSAIRAWEDSTYRSFDSAAKSLADRARRKLVVDTTDADGYATLRVPASEATWWLSAGAWDVTDPNMSWYWNVKADRDTVLLDSRSGRRRPRY